MDPVSTRFIDSLGSRVPAIPNGFARAARITLRALGSQLNFTPEYVRMALGSDLWAEFDAGHRHRVVEPDQVVGDLVANDGLSPGRARELAQAIVAELSSRLVAASRTDLRRRLPPVWASWVCEPPPGCANGWRAPTDPRQTSANRTLTTAGPSETTLARGRPGSQHPLVDAR